MTLLSVNINKFALIRNARGANHPNLNDICEKCISYGADGITVHPRPDERHVKFSDLHPIFQTIQNSKKRIEFNIEGYPSKKFCKIVGVIMNTFLSKTDACLTATLKLSAAVPIAYGRGEVT